MIRVDAPIEQVADAIRDAGYEPTMVRIDIVAGEMQTRFDDKHAGCGAEGTAEYIEMTIPSVVEVLIEGGHFDEG